MAEIKFTIPDEKLDRVINAIVGKHPIPEVDGVPEYTKTQWAKEYIRRLLVRTVYSYERDNAASAINQEDDLIS